MSVPHYRTRFALAELTLRHTGHRVRLVQTIGNVVLFVLQIQQTHIARSAIKSRVELVLQAIKALIVRQRELLQQQLLRDLIDADKLAVATGENAGTVRRITQTESQTAIQITNFESNQREKN